MADLGRMLLVLGGSLALAGAALLALQRFGRLPGDLVVERGPVTFVFPLMTCLLISVAISVVLTLGLNLLARR